MGSDGQGVVTLCCDLVCALALYVALYTKLILIALSAAKWDERMRRYRYFFISFGKVISAAALANVMPSA
jgi:hypothetical protein